MVPCSFAMKIVFSYNDTQIQYSVSDHIRFTAKNNKLFWKYCISTMCEAGMKPSLYIKLLSWILGQSQNICNKVCSTFAKDTDRWIYKLSLK